MVQGSNISLPASGCFFFTFLLLSCLQYFPDSGTRGRREGTGSTEATEMILNNLFYITAKVTLHEINLTYLSELIK